MLKINTGQIIRTIFKIFSNLNNMKILRLKFTGNYKSFCRIVWKSFEKILENVWGNFNEILQVEILSKICEKTLYLNIFYNLWIELILRNFRRNSKKISCKFSENFKKTLKKNFIEPWSYKKFSENIQNLTIKYLESRFKTCIFEKPGKLINCATKVFAHSIKQQCAMKQLAISFGKKWYKDGKPLEQDP